MPTVAFFSPAWPASIAASGIVSYVDGMARGIQSRGWKSVVLAGRIGETDVSCGIAAYSVRRSSRLEQVALKCLYQPRTFADNLVISFKQLNKKHQLDIIEMEESFGWAANVARALPIPVIVRLHGPWFLTGITEVSTGDPAFIDRVARERQGILAAAGVTAPSQKILDLTRNYYDLPLTHAVVIPNPASPTQLVETPTEIPAIYGQVVLYVGRFEFVKGGDLAIRAFGELARLRPNCHFVFIGPDHGLENAKGSRLSLAEFVRQYFPSGQIDRLHLLGQQPPNVVNAWRQRADTIVVTSRFENFPMVVLEAMQARKPIVATAVGGIPELITHDKTGLLVKSECVESMVVAIQRLLDDRVLANQLCANAAVEVKERFSLASVLELSKTYYESIIKGFGF